MTAPLQLIETTPRRRPRLGAAVQGLALSIAGGIVGVLFWL